MKKYLMMGAAVLALASCNKTEDIAYVDRDVANYEQAFIKAYGQPSENQTWGFGTTRAAINVNGNEWKTCPTLGENEESDVTTYVRNLTTYPNVAPTGLVNYYVTQVHCGTDTYYDKDGNGPILGSSKMNHLMIAQESTATITDGVLSEGWLHINNFNRGDDTDWDGNTLVVDGGTFDFAYIGSEDSKYHNKWIAIDGADIADEYANYCYVCFDFEQSAAAKTVIKFRDENNNPLQGYIDGAWDKTLGIEQVWGKTFVVDIYDWQTGETTPTTFTVGQEGTSEWELDNIVNGNQIVDADNDYTDWIIRLVKAEPANGYDLRVMAEDLSAKEASDFDFNDVVFDAKVSNDTAYVKLLAAGGTLPLRFFDDDNLEVHKLFDVDVKTMVNTQPNKHNEYAPVEFIITGRSIASVKDIRIFVYKNDAWKEMTAYTGMPASKFGCPVGTDWADERQDIDKKWNGSFKIWVGDETKPFWADWNNDEE